jgi:hypothetical protein
MTQEQFNQLISTIEHWATQIELKLEAIRCNIIDIETELHKD